MRNVCNLFRSGSHSPDSLYLNSFILEFDFSAALQSQQMFHHTTLQFLKEIFPFKKTLLHQVEAKDLMRSQCLKHI